MNTAPNTYSSAVTGLSPTQPPGLPLTHQTSSRRFLSLYHNSTPDVVFERIGAREITDALPLIYYSLLPPFRFIPSVGLL